MKHSNLVTVGLLLLATVLALVMGCASSEREGERLANQPPRVWLASAPPEGTTSKYTIRLYWGGWDPDGDVDHYEYTVTDNSTGVFNPADTVETGSGQCGDDDSVWHCVYANDSTFTFSADSLGSGTTSNPLVREFVRSHTFFIRAVDDRGATSPRPAYRSFTARTLSPSVSIEVPIRNGLNPAAVPPISRFQWKATDYIESLLTTQEPDSVQWAMVDVSQFDGNYDFALDYLRKKPSVLQQFGKTAADADAEWGPWVWYGAPGDSGKNWVTPPKDFGPNIFAIRAKDEAGAVTPVLDEIRNVRRVLVSPRSTGPILTVSNQFLGSVTATKCTSPPLIADLPAGISIDFTMRADASGYGGVVSGYRYGWDITDLEDPEQWDTDLIPMTASTAKIPGRTFFFGTHTFTLEAVDNSGYCSRVQVKVNIVRFTMERNLLLVDDAAESPGLEWNDAFFPGAQPSDEEHDAFWLRMLDGVAGFDPVNDVLEVKTGVSIPLTKVADYKSIVWSVFSNLDTQEEGDMPGLYRYLKFKQKNPPQGGITGKAEPNLLALFLAAGGHLFLSGNNPVTTNINRPLAGGSRMPFIFLYESEGNQNAPSAAAINNPPGDLSFGYREMCVNSVDMAVQSINRWRTANQSCSIEGYRSTDNNVRRDTGMRGAISQDAFFPDLEMHSLTAGPGRFYEESRQGLDVEIYNPQYFSDLCPHVPDARPCFQPIYGLRCLRTTERTYDQPIAFWTSAFADRVPDVPGGVGARSVVWGFPPVYFEESQVKPGIEHILFDEWQLPRN